MSEMATEFGKVDGMNTHVNAPEMRPIPANLQDGPTDAECFLAIDTWVREKVKEWVPLARACMEVRMRSLYFHGGFSSWDGWLNSAAPGVSARTIYWHISLIEGLEADFTDEQIGAMPPETAKQVRKLPKSLRNDPALREASTRKQKAFVETLKRDHPEQLIETDSMLAFSLSETQRDIIEEEFAYWEEQDGEMTRGDILVCLCLAAGEARKSGRSV